MNAWRHLKRRQSCRLEGQSTGSVVGGRVHSMTTVEGCFSSYSGNRFDSYKLLARWLKDEFKN